MYMTLLLSLYDNYCAEPIRIFPHYYAVFEGQTPSRNSHFLNVCVISRLSFCVLS